MPKRGDDIFARNQLLSPANQKNQELHGFLFKPDPAAAASKLVAAEIKLDSRSILERDMKNAFGR